MVTDPHYNTLLSHEIIGHPVELDRGLKMEAAYAGRSWLLRGLDDHQVGKQVASPLVTAYSDPSLPGYGHYAYDHEGTPARRVVHIDRGVFRGFMNSRQTAAVFGGEPNGHWKSTEAALVPLVRMSSTVFAAGDRDPADIIGEVDRGYYLVGHKIPSIAESRENFRISARKVYEIDHGRLGRLYRDGGIMADSRDYLMKVDAVGDDFRLYPISNCGKGQPMQTKKLGNGGPTMRSRAVLTGGALAMGRLVTAWLVAVALFWVSPAPADDPEVPGEVRVGRPGQCAPRAEEAGDLHRRASQGAVRRAPHPGRQEHPLDRAAEPTRQPLQAGLPRPLLSVPTRVGPGGLQGAVPGGISEHGDPRRGHSGLGEEALPDGEDRGEELVACGPPS